MEKLLEDSLSLLNIKDQRLVETGDEETGKGFTFSNVSEQGLLTRFNLTLDETCNLILSIEIWNFDFKEREKVKDYDEPEEPDPEDLLGMHQFNEEHEKVVEAFNRFSDEIYEKYSFSVETLEHELSNHVLLSHEICTSGQEEDLIYQIGQVVKVVDQIGSKVLNVMLGLKQRRLPLDKDQWLGK